MIQTKYLIIIGAIVCLLILYYFYDEISNVKKLFLPTYQKTMALEAKVLDLEKKTNEFIQKKNPIIQKNDSPAMTISYQSDMIKNGNLSVRYADLSDTEAKELLNHMDQHRTKQVTTCFNNNTIQPLAYHPQNTNLPIINQEQVVKKNFTVESGDISDFLPAPNTINNDFYDDETDTINIKISDLIKKNNQSNNLGNNTDNAEYQQILNGLTKNISTINSENSFDEDTELDQDIIKSISESIKYADLPSDNIMSDIPVIPAPKKSVKNINKSNINASKNINKSKNMNKNILPKKSINKTK